MVMPGWMIAFLIGALLAAFLQGSSTPSPPRQAPVRRPSPYQPEVREALTWFWGLSMLALAGVVLHAVCRYGAAGGP